MKFKELELSASNHFVAMEYYLLILNRTFLLVIYGDFLIGIKVNGMISIEAGADPIGRKISQTMAIQGDLENPNSYIKAKYIQRIDDIDLTSSEFFQVNKANFRIKLNDIKEVTYNPKKKWGMGYYPHDGRVYVTTKEGKKRELIILGRQSGEEIWGYLKKAVEDAHNKGFGVSGARRTNNQHLI